MPRETMSTASSFGEHIVRHSTVSRTSLTESLLDDPVAATERGPQPEPPGVHSFPPGRRAFLRPIEITTLIILAPAQTCGPGDMRRSMRTTRASDWSTAC